MTNAPVPTATWHSDCTQCRALCCTAFAFDADQGFGFDKPAATPCRHLDDAFGCRIHARLAHAGFPACAHFDCHGAGQRATARFGGRQAVLDAAATGRLFEHYRRLLPLHEAGLLLHLAGERLGSDAEYAGLRDTLAAAAAAIDVLCQDEPAVLTDAQVRQACEAARAALRGLAGLPALAGRMHVG